MTTTQEAATKTLAEIAAEHGWTLEQRGSRAQTVYYFTKGNLRIRFSRAGHGTMSILWKPTDNDWARAIPVPWNPRFEEGSNHYTPSTRTREEYMAALLPRVSEEKARNEIAARLRTNVAMAENELRAAQRSLNAFLILTKET